MPAAYYETWLTKYARWFPIEVEADMGDTKQDGSIGRRFFARQDALRGGPDPELCTSDYQAWLGGNPAIDRAGHEAFAKAFYAGFPDMNHEVVDVLVDGDKVAVRFVLEGTHTGLLFGMIPATQKRMKVFANVLMHLHEGRVRKLFGVFDEAGMLRQLGVIAG
jgi:predicted ester cyclase